MPEGKATDPRCTPLAAVPTLTPEPTVGTRPVVRRGRTAGVVARAHHTADEAMPALLSHWYRPFGSIAKIKTCNIPA